MVWHGDCCTTWRQQILGDAMILQVAPIDSAVIPDLKAFIVVLSHLPVEVQVEILRDATKQIVTEVLEPITANERG